MRLKLSNPKRLSFGPPKYFALAAGAALWLSAGAGLPFGAFTGCTETSAVISTKADFTGPTVTGVISKTPGYQSGFIKYNGSYYIYANAAETNPTNGNPPNGVNASSLTANVAVTSNVITTGATSVALSSSGGPWTVSGTSYTYRSAVQTVNNALLNGYTGDRNFTVTASDTAGNTTTTNPALVVSMNSTVPAASDIAANNVGATPGRPEATDTVVYTTSKALDPESILSGWDGSSTAVKLKFANNSSNDTFVIRNTGDTADLPLGTVATGANFVGTSPATFNATMVKSGQNITITLGTISNGGTVNTVTANNMTWTPSATAYDVYGINMSTTSFTESISDRDF